MVHLKDEGVELLLTSLKDVELCYVLALLCCIVLYCCTVSDVTVTDDTEN